MSSESQEHNAAVRQQHNHAHHHHPRAAHTRENEAAFQEHDSLHKANVVHEVHEHTSDVDAELHAHLPSGSISPPAVQISFAPAPVIELFAALQPSALIGKTSTSSQEMHQQIHALQRAAGVARQQPDEQILRQIIQPGVLDGVVMLLGHAWTPVVVIEAARTLANWSHHSEILSDQLSRRGAVESLLQLLPRHLDNMEVVRCATHAIANLFAHSNENVVLATNIQIPWPCSGAPFPCDRPVSGVAALVHLLRHTAEQGYPTAAVQVARGLAHCTRVPTAAALILSAQSLNHSPDDKGASNPSSPCAVTGCPLNFESSDEASESDQSEHHDAPNSTSEHGLPSPALRTTSAPMPIPENSLNRARDQSRARFYSYAMDIFSGTLKWYLEVEEYARQHGADLNVEENEDNDVTFFLARVFANISLMEGTSGRFLSLAEIPRQLVALLQIKPHPVSSSRIYAPITAKLIAQTVANIGVHTACCVQLLSENCAATLIASMQAVLAPIVAASSAGSLSQQSTALAEYLEEHSELVRCLTHAIANIAQVSQDERVFAPLVQPLTLALTVAQNEVVLATFGMCIFSLCADSQMAHAFSRADLLARLRAQHSRIIVSRSDQLGSAHVAAALFQLDRAQQPLVELRPAGIHPDRLSELFEKYAYEVKKSSDTPALVDELRDDQIFRMDSDEDSDVSCNDGCDGCTHDDEAQCPICMECVAAGDVMVRLPSCGHVFHVSCVGLWLESHTACPMCRCEVLKR
ncbi:hypothetical protein CAOG_07678 [Capsaspora owczarzaki ATCC 30864]|uniref:RING-type domain-containing protein n=1 Tax=Capsaspora owczarzaki (strain ATCC 30864) TaxID=595528 RepID=A0A0D2VZG3_CAPO3|nr:hypothetical protein CAOG_07678 [Capsaspora owczarzaki ATCC 30864]KJE97237.1 hypothetical protein CAOG_007678 [Capsaspora owczarzaki ATCC 30864]|eukprot:XP_004343552.1 hypothetical protein CAOG_07678 [Capsaspora owczarzaki ATCC 30864]